MDCIEGNHQPELYIIIITQLLNIMLWNRITIYLHIGLLSQEPFRDIEIRFTNAQCLQPPLSLSLSPSASSFIITVWRYCCCWLALFILFLLLLLLLFHSFVWSSVCVLGIWQTMVDSFWLAKSIFNSKMLSIDDEIEHIHSHISAHRL